MTADPSPLPDAPPPRPSATLGLRSPWAWMPSAITTLLAFFLVWGFLRPIDWDDLGWHIRVGNWILEHGRIPNTNILVWTTPEHPFVPHEWLAEVIFASLDAIGGMRLLLVTRAVVFALTLLLLVDLGKRAGAERLALAALIFAVAWGMGTQATLRPWLFSNFLLVLSLWLFERGGRARALLPAVFLVWANLHGGFIVGLGLIGLRLAAEWLLAPPVRRRALTFSSGLLVAACVVACMLTPLGPAHMLFPLRYLFAPEDGTGIRLMKQSITEWLPITFDTLDGGVWIALVVALAATLVLSRSARRDVRPWVALALLALCLRETRHLAVASAIGFGAIASGLLAPFAARVQQAGSAGAGGSAFLRRLSVHSHLESLPRSGFAGIVLVATVVLFATYARGPGFERAVTEPGRYPFDAFAVVESRAPKRLFHFYEYCGPIAWKIPASELFVVGIHDAQPESLFSDYLRIVHREAGWEEALARWAPDLVLMPAGHPLVADLRTRGWTDAHEDDTAAVLLPPGES